MHTSHTTWLRRVVFYSGLVVLGAGAAITAWSFWFDNAYLDNHRVAVAITRWTHPGSTTLIYGGYEDQVRDAAIQTMNAGIWVSLVGVGLAGLSLTSKRRPSAQPPPADTPAP